jgi:hypothetical protein
MKDGQVQFFGTVYKPNIRWMRVACGANNVSNLGVPLRPVERVSCKVCHRMRVVPIDMSQIPKHFCGTTRKWGSANENYDNA